MSELARPLTKRELLNSMARDQWEHGQIGNVTMEAINTLYDDLAASRAEVGRLRMLLSAAKTYGSHIIGLNVETGDPFHAEVEGLRGLLRQLLQHRGYVYVAQPTDYICSHCGGQWEMSDRERHGDNCPVALAKAEVGAPAGTAAMRRSLLIDIGAIDQ